MNVLWNSVSIKEKQQNFFIHVLKKHNREIYWLCFLFFEVYLLKRIFQKLCRVYHQLSDRLFVIIFVKSGGLRVQCE